jgi:hypothetical protein
MRQQEVDQEFNLAFDHVHALVNYAPPFRGGDKVVGVGPGVDTPLAAGVDHAEAGGVEPAAFVGSGSETDAPRDDGVA